MIESKPFLTLPDGQTAQEFVLSRPEEQFTVRLTDLGAVITAILTPDRAGQLRDVALGFGDPNDYLTNDPGFGALIGRVANRIDRAEFELDGRTYALTANRPGYTLHGGRDGYQFRRWTATASECDGIPTLTLHLISPDGDQGFPGTLRITVVYRVKPGRTLEIDYRATTDAPTLVNLTNHCYFNLNGEGAGDAFDHQYQLDAERRTPNDARLVPTGEIVPLRGTPYDFSTPVCLAERRAELPTGLDDNFIFGANRRGSVYAPSSGIRLNFATTEPAVQCYTASFLDGSCRDKSGRPHRRFGGFCLEAQHYPDAPHHPNFPSIVLRPGEVYRQTTTYAFDLQ